MSRWWRRRPATSRRGPPDRAPSLLGVPHPSGSGRATTGPAVEREAGPTAAVWPALPAWRAPLHPKQHPNQTVQREPAGSGPRPSPFHCGVAAIWSPIEPPSRRHPHREPRPEAIALSVLDCPAKLAECLEAEAGAERGSKDSSPQGGRPLWAAKKAPELSYACPPTIGHARCCRSAKQCVRGDGACIGQSPQFRRRDRPQLLPLCLIEPLNTHRPGLRHQERRTTRRSSLYQEQPICRCAPGATASLSSSVRQSRNPPPFAKNCRKSFVPIMCESVLLDKPAVAPRDCWPKNCP